MSGRLVWNRGISDASSLTGTVGAFYVDVYRTTPGGRWGWHVWSTEPYASVYAWQRGGSRWFRFLAVRDALREIATLRGGRT